MSAPPPADTVDVVFAFHGFPGAIHQLVHGRPDADRFHVRGFIEQGTTTPFDMAEISVVRVRSWAGQDAVLPGQV